MNTKSGLRVFQKGVELQKIQRLRKGGEMTRPKPYIGITGFGSRSDVEGVLSVLSEDHDLMVGTLASNKTLRGQPSNPRRYPTKEAHAAIFTDHANVLNLVHFNTGEPELLCSDLLRMRELAGPFCHGFQLNMPWPDKRAIEQYRCKEERSTTIVLQCGKRALHDVDWSPSKLAECVREYAGLVEYVLIDASGGAGVAFDDMFVSICFRKLQSIPDIGFGVAGGLSVPDLGRLISLLQEFPDGFSTDVETGVRDEYDRFCVKTARRYLHIHISHLEWYAKNT